MDVAASELPADALLQRYRDTDDPPRAYTDCFSVDIDRKVSLADFVFAFYTTPLFRLERIILRVAARLPSTDEDARQLMAGTREQFAAWTVEARADDQLLMCDFRERTRSWFMAVDRDPGGSAGTRLYFGSAVVAVRNRSSGEYELGRSYSLLLSFHRLYSVLLLRAAARALQKVA